MLASGAQQLLSIQPQLMAFQHHQQQQHQQQLPENHLFYRHKSQQMDSSEPSIHSRKDHHMNQFKMRNREMSKRLSRLSRGINGHGDMIGHQGMVRDAHEEPGSQMNR